jgi:hypothetical protein
LKGDPDFILQGSVTVFFKVDSLPCHTPSKNNFMQRGEQNFPVLIFDADCFYFFAAFVHRV